MLDPDTALLGHGSRAPDPHRAFRKFLSKTMFYVLRPLRLLMKSLVTQTTPHQLATGFAFGVLIGLIPKGNLIAVTLGVILAASRANLAIAAGVIIAVSGLSGFFDPQFHAIGHFLLSLPALQSLWTWLYNQPLMQWTSFQNTVVLGSLVAGLALVWPAYRGSRPLFEKYSSPVAGWAARFRLVRFLFGVEWAERFTGVPTV